MDIVRCPHCHTHVLPSDDGKCPHCAGDVKGTPAPSRPRPDGAISKVCPGCGSAKYREVSTVGLVFAKDRMCVACGCKYRPPTPVWAAIFFILLGSLMILGLGYSAVLRVLNPEPSSIGLCFEIPLIVLGVGAVIAGIRALPKAKSPS